jgi:hypothetical protein
MPGTDEKRKCYLHSSQVGRLHLGRRYFASDFLVQAEEPPPLMTRAWVLQELALTPRTLHYSLVGLVVTPINRNAGHWQRLGVVLIYESKTHVAGDYSLVSVETLLGDSFNHNTMILV